MVKSEAYYVGFGAGFMNIRPARNPYVELSPEWVDWEVGYDDGQYNYIHEDEINNGD